MDDYFIWGKISEVYNLITKARASELKKQGLTPEHSHIIRILIEKGGSSTLNEIAGITLKRHNTVSLLVKRMEKAGLVCRKKDNSNRYKISITEKGIELFETMPLNSIDMIFSSISDEEKQTLVSILEKLDQHARHILGLDYIPPLFR